MELSRQNCFAAASVYGEFPSAWFDGSMIEFDAVYIGALDPTVATVPDCSRPSEITSLWVAAVQVMNDLLVPLPQNDVALVT